MSFYGKNTNISSDYVNVYNSWCHFENDSYFTKVQYSNLLDKSALLNGLANISGHDTWRTMGTFNFHSSTLNSTTPVQISCIAAGAFPTFTNNFFSLEKTTYHDSEEVGRIWYEQTYLEITPTTNGLKVGNANFGYNTLIARDNTTPKFICFALQGAGGGGGGSMLADGPAGGGFMGAGKNGTKGAGGSGARYTVLPGSTISLGGGRGGDGCAYFWY